MNLKSKKIESFFLWSIGIVFILIMLCVACLPYFAIMPENLFTKFLTVILCLFLLFIEIIVIGLSIANVKATQGQ